MDGMRLEISWKEKEEGDEWQLFRNSWTMDSSR